MKKRGYHILLIIVLLMMLVMASIFFRLSNTKETNKLDEISVPISVDEIITILSKEYGVSNITPSPDNSLVTYLKSEDNQEYSIYLWRLGHYQPIQMSEMQDKVVEIVWNPTSSKLIVCQELNNQFVSMIIQIADPHKDTGILKSVSIPMWSPNGEMLAVVINDKNINSIVIYNSSLEIINTITHSKDLRINYKLNSWDKDNTISYKELNVISNQEASRSYAYAKTVYNIVGDSNKLSKKASENMINWRNEIIIQAKYNAKDLFINGDSKKKMVALTFDDGPDEVNTPKTLDILKKYNIKASFFIVGEQAEKYPHIVKRIVDEGHLVLNHSYDHKNYEYFNSDQIYEDILKTQTIIENITGVKPLLIRTPYGIVNDIILKQTQKLNNKIILWSTDTLDWSQRDVDNIIKNTINNVRPGEIILYHTTKYSHETVEALPVIIEKLIEQGYKLVDVGELLEIKAYEDNS